MGDMRLISSTVKELMQQVGSYLIMCTKALDVKSFAILTNTRMERDESYQNARLTTGTFTAAHYILILNTHCQL